MANPEHLKILKEGVEAWNEWRKNNPDIVPNLRGVDLEGAELVGANLTKAALQEAVLKHTFLLGADLSQANLFEAKLASAYLMDGNLYKAILISANLCSADLRNATLNAADLRGADVIEANLSGASLRRANLDSVSFLGANLSGADLCFAAFVAGNVEGTTFSDSTMESTSFANVDLSKAKGLDEVRHVGPSTIGIDTVQRSQGKIPEIFLRGAGVSDEFIAMSRSLAGAVQFYSCFISYSTKDQLFAERLYADLQAKGVRCWFAPHDVQGGKKLHEQIDNAIRVHERLLLILSPDSINSEWVKTEIAKARKRELIEKKRMLFPVRLKISFKELQEWECFDADTGKDSAREIREYYIPDFSEWETAAKFKEEFDKLVRDLKRVEEAGK